MFEGMFAVSSPLNESSRRLCQNLGVFLTTYSQQIGISPLGVAALVRYNKPSLQLQNEKMRKWRVLLAESHPLIRQTIVEILLRVAKVRLVAKVDNGWDVIFTSSQVKPDIILLDFDLPGLSGLEVTPLIKRGLPQTQVVILLDEENDSRIKAVEQCGARAYLVKSQLAQELPSLLDKLEQTKKRKNVQTEYLPQTAP